MLHSTCAHFTPSQADGIDHRAEKYPRDELRDFASCVHPQLDKKGDASAACAFVENQHECPQYKALPTKKVGVTHVEPAGPYKKERTTLVTVRQGIMGKGEPGWTVSSKLGSDPEQLMEAADNFDDAKELFGIVCDMAEGKRANMVPLAPPLSPPVTTAPKASSYVYNISSTY